MTSNWLTQSFLAVLLLIPIWISIGFLDRNHGLKPEAFLFWYFIGVIATTVLFGSVSLQQLAPSCGAVLAALTIGLVLGGAANIFVFRSVATAPNPGLALAINNSASVGVFFATILLSRWAPDQFNPVKIDLISMIGVLLTFIGIAMIVIRR